MFFGQLLFRLIAFFGYLPSFCDELRRLNNPEFVSSKQYRIDFPIPHSITCTLILHIYLINAVALFVRHGFKPKPCPSPYCAIF